MKKKSILITILCTLLALAACGAKAATTATMDQSGAVTAGGPDAPLSDAELLIIGTLKLKGTDQEVDASQAVDLLAYWQLYKSMYTSDTAAQEEIDAIINTIKSTLTEDQMAAIEALGLTQKDMMTAMQELGIGFSVQTNDQGETTTQNLPEGAIIVGGPGQGGAVPGGGTMSGGIPPSGGPVTGGGPGGEIVGSITIQGGDMTALDPETLSTLQAGGGQVGRGGGNMMLSPLLDAIIQYLTERSES